ncbi:MAG: NADP-dependent phosphogluconate dehydrogenase [Proteobacteria bacterium]|nr:NADP-dependent phosphogluconate dehydrogenase [Pseudomonadota bacterium]
MNTQPQHNSAAPAIIGVAGLGVMGKNLALNIESRGFPVAVWNRSYARTEALLAEKPDSGFVPAPTIEAFVASIRRPRAIVLMLTAGSAIDAAIDQFAPLLEAGDILVDGGNSWFEDTERREQRLKAQGIHYVGLGVSGGEEGARLGPSLMPGGSAVAYEAIADVLVRIAAQTDSGACVTHVGPGGAGHFVKMVHNGIEYADMQLIAEAYHLLSAVGGMDAAQQSQVFARYNEGPLASFLIELTAQVLAVTDPATQAPLVDQILDSAAQKGTGQWTLQAATALAIPVPVIAAAVDARIISSRKAARVTASALYANHAHAHRSSGDATLEGDALITPLEDALWAAKVIAYAQGLDLIQAASAAYNWNIRIDECARIWKGGCIIRARLLDDIMKAFRATPAPANLLVAPDFVAPLAKAIPALRQMVQLGVSAGIPVAALAASLAYFDAGISAQLPQNLIQAQRDAFGAHTFVRRDDPDGPGHHFADWLK